MIRYVLSVFLCAVATLPAADSTWLGNTSVFWNADNWLGSNSPPVDGDAVFFGPAGNAGAILSNDFPNGLSLSGITFNSNASAYTISPSWTALTGDIVNSSTNLQVLNMGHELRADVRIDAAGAGLQFGVNHTINLNGNTLTVTGAFDTVINLRVSGAGGNSRLVKDGPGELSIGVGSLFQGGLTVNEGVMRPNTMANLSGNGTTVNGGALNFSVNNTYGNAAATVVAPLLVSGGMVTNTSTFTALGPVTLNAGTLSGGGGVTNNHQMYSLTKTVFVGGNGASFVTGPPAGWPHFGGVHLGALAGNMLTFDVADATGDAGSDLIVSASLIDRNVEQGGGAGALQKSGSGTMLLTGTNAYSGETRIQEGTLALGSAGAIVGSDLITVGTDVGSSAVLDVSALATAFSPSGTQTLKGFGTVTGSVIIANGARLVPGDEDAVGTNFFSNHLTLGDGGMFVVDLSAPGSGGENDLVNVGGTLSLSTGAVLSVRTSGSLVEGEYALFSYAGGFNGVLDPVVEYTSRQGVSLTDRDSTVWLSVTGSVADLYWTGIDGATWHTGGSTNWHDGVAADRFFDADRVRFDDRGTPNGVVTIAGSVHPGALVVSNETSSYTFSGAGAIEGLTGLVKQGSNSLTIANANTYVGDTSIQGGTLRFSGAGTTSEDSAITVGPGSTLTFDKHDTWGLANTPSSAGVTVSSGATLASGGHFTTLWDAHLNGGTVLLNGGANPSYPAFQFAGTLSVGGTNGSVIEVGTGVNNLINVGGTGNGTLVLNTDDATGDAASDLVVGAPLQNYAATGSLTKTGQGTVDLTATNTYTGNTIVDDGLLRVRDGGALPATVAVITRGGAELAISNGSVTVAANVGSVFGVGYGALGTGTVTVSHGVLNIGNGGGRTFIGGGPPGGPFGNGVLTISDGGIVNAGPAGVNPNNNLWFNGFGNSGACELNLDPGGVLNTAREMWDGSNGDSTVNFNGGLIRCTTDFSVFLRVNHANVRDGGVHIDTQTYNVVLPQTLLHSTLPGDAVVDGGLTKTGSGMLTLASGASSFSGDVSIEDGTLICSVATGSLNPTQGSIGNPQVAGRTITVHSNALLRFTTHDVLGNAASLPLVHCVVEGGTLSSSNSLTTLGDITLNGGTLLADKGTAVGSRGAFDLNGTVSVTGDVTSVLLPANGPDAIFRLNNIAPYVTTFDVADGLAVSDLVVAGELGNPWSLNAGGLKKTGAGAMVLSGVNTYSGPTTVSNGSLIVNGSLNAAGSVIVAGGGALGGMGAVGNVTVESGASIAPGDQNALGSLSVLGDLIMEENSVYEWGSNQSTGDVVQVDGLLTLPERLTVNASHIGPDFVGELPLFTFATVGGNTNSLIAWDVTGLMGLPQVTLEPNRVVIRMGRGLLFTVR